MATDEELLLIRIEASQTKMEKELNRALSNLNGAEKKIARSQANLTKRIEQSWSSLGRSLVPSLAGIGAALSTREIVQYADAWRNAGNKLASSGTPLEQVQTRLEQLSEAATNSRTSFDTTAAAYQRLRIATERLGVSEKDALRYTELINKSFVAGGASGTEAASAALQLSQALGSGTLQGDELRSLRENAPLLARAIADAMHTSIGGLKQLGAEGKITADIILKALNQSAGSIEDRFSKTQETVGQAFTNLETAFTRFVGSASGDELNALTTSIDFLAKHLDDAAKIIGIAAAALGPAGLIAAARGATVAMGALWAIMAANPIGAVLSVITAAAAALYLYRDRLGLVTDGERRINEIRERGLTLQQQIATATGERLKQLKAERDQLIENARAELANAKAKVANIQASFAKTKGAQSGIQAASPGLNVGALLGAQETVQLGRARAQVIAAQKALDALTTPPASATGGGGTGGNTASATAGQGQGQRQLARMAERDAEAVRDAILRANDDVRQSDLTIAESRRDVVRAQDDALLEAARGTQEYFGLQKDVIAELAKLDIGSINDRKTADLAAIEDRLAASKASLEDERKSRAAQLEAQSSGPNPSISKADAAKALQEFDAAAAQQRIEFERSAAAQRTEIEQKTASEIVAINVKKNADLTQADEDYYQTKQNLITLNDGIRQGLMDIGVAGLHGFGSLKDAAAQALDQIAQMILQMYVLKPLVEGLLGKSGTSGGGILGGLLGSFFGGGAGLGAATDAAIAANPLLFSSGGYTGAGGVNQPAGIVHKGEVVFSQADVARLGGVGSVEALRRGMSIPTISAPAGGGGGGPTIIQQFDLRGAVVTEDLYAKMNATAAAHANAAVSRFNDKVLPSRVASLKPRQR